MDRIAKSGSEKETAKMKRSRRYLTFLLLPWAIMGTVKAAEWVYRVESPLLGRLGTLKIYSEEYPSSYRILAEAKTEGIAAVMTKQRREKYLSEGERKENRYMARHFLIDRTSGTRHETDEYMWKIPGDKVTKHRLKWKKGVIERNSTGILPYYSDEDPASLYHNAVSDIADVVRGVKEYAVIGAEKAGGTVRIIRPDHPEEESARKHLGAGRDLHIVYIVSPGRILGRKNRKLVLAVDGDGVVHKAGLSEVPVVGEIIVTLEKLR
jgi:hypothetical protein